MHAVKGQKQVRPGSKAIHLVFWEIVLVREGEVDQSGPCHIREPDIV